MNNSAAPRDERLRSLPSALDTVAMQPVFEASFFGADGRYRVAGCEIERVRYKPAQNCLICYRLRIEDRMTQTLAEQLCAGRVYEAGGSLTRYARAALALASSQNVQATCPVIKPLVHLPELDMVVWAFPNDRKLTGLPYLTDASYLRTVLLPPVIAQQPGSAWHIASLRHTLAHYNPEHSCMVRVELQLQHAHTGERRPRVLYGKTYDDDSGADTYRVMSALWETAAVPGSQLHIARPLGYQPEQKLLWQRGLPGQPLLALGLDSPGFGVVLEQAAVVVAALHQTRVEGLRYGTVHDWVARLKEMRAWLSRVRPTCQQAVEQAVDHLLDQAGTLGEQPVATLHGDLHLQNFSYDGERVTLIDLDNVYAGSPWQDVGSLVASLLAQRAGLTTGLSAARGRELAAVFCAAYQRHVPWRVSEQALNWFIAAALINERAFRCVTRLKAGRLNQVDTLLALVAGLLAGATSESITSRAGV